jgi:hypothetical protein
MGNKPKVMKTRYQERKEGKDLNQLEVKNNAAVNFIAHNANIGKWWNDPQIKKEDWRASGKLLTNYILSNGIRTKEQIEKWKKDCPVRAMNTIRRVMMQINQANGNRDSDQENQIMEIKCYLCFEALKINEPIGNLKTLKEIMKTIEETFILEEEYLMVKTEILVKANEWKEAIMMFNSLKSSPNEGEIVPLIDRMNIMQEKNKEHEQIERRNRLISYNNCISKNLFEKDEEINRTTKLMWNRDYQEAIDEACKIWTTIMSISKPEMIFAKTKVLQIMIESTLSLVMSDIDDAEGWLETLKGLDYNGIMTAILNIKMMMRKNVEKEIGWRGSGLPNPVFGRRGFNGSDFLGSSSPQIPGNACQV